MHIVLCHGAVVPPHKYGGTERIVYWLGKALLAQGHRVTLMAHDGSRLEGAAFIRIDGQSWTDLIPADADVVHLWCTPSIPEQQSRLQQFPYLVTIQGNGKPGERFLANTLFISRKHAANHGAREFVHNGIDLDEYPMDSQRDDRLVFLAKASWKVKNLKGARDLARRTGLPLDVMGSRDFPLRLQRALPRVRGVRYLGMVDDAEKREFLRGARALLFPVRWHEPFGIAIIEALASGCAVFGTPYGSLPEIVTPECGVLSDRADVLAQAIRDHRFSPETCRARVANAFSHVRMARSYLRYYERLRAHGTIEAPELPAAERTGFVAAFRDSAETLLPWFA